MEKFELKLYARIHNLKERSRLAFLEGMMAYIELTERATESEVKYINEMYEHLFFNGTDDQSLAEFYDAYNGKEGK